MTGDPSSRRDATSQMNLEARDRILERIRNAVSRRPHAIHPGAFREWRPGPSLDPLDEEARVDGFEALFVAAGGEVVREPNLAAGATWLRSFAGDFASVSHGRGVPPALRPDLPSEAPAAAHFGVSMARGAVAETGSLILDARDGRRAQLLVPTHVVVVNRHRVYPTLRSALNVLQTDLPSAIGLHSGPSKSADIGQIMVKGVHGPGRVVALILGDMSE